MTPRERADELHAGLLLWSGPLNHTWVAELIAETIEADRKEQVAISDIHGQLWECPECAFGFDARHENEGGGYSCPVCDLAQRDRRIADLETALRDTVASIDKITHDEIEARLNAVLFATAQSTTAICACGHSLTNFHETPGTECWLCMESDSPCARFTAAPAQPATAADEEAENYAAEARILAGVSRKRTGRMVYGAAPPSPAATKVDTALPLDPAKLTTGAACGNGPWPEGGTADSSFIRVRMVPANPETGPHYVSATLKCKRCNGSGWYKVPGGIEARCLHPDRDSSSNHNKEPK